MKKYILFFISIGLLLGVVLFYNTMSIEKERKVTFNESGYILNSSTERYYFYEDETYTNSYDNKIVFYDTEGSKVTLKNDNFIHYSSGNIVGLQESVLLELSGIEDDPIIYYNVNANKEIKKVSNRYVVKNLGKDLQFEQAIWKISSTKYIILGDSITIKLENGTERTAEGYVEIQYSDNEIINIYNQTFSYQTIASDSVIELDDNIKINLGTKIVSKEDDNKMSLEDMVINADDNVTLIDLNVEEEKEDENNVDENNTTEENTETIQQGNNSTITNNSNINNNSQSTIINQGTGNNGNNSGAQNTIDIEIPDIDFDQFNNDEDNNETIIDPSEAVVEPKFKLDKMKITAHSIKGTIKITDEKDVLSREDDVQISIINNSTGKKVYSDSVQYGTLSIPLTVETLIPNTQYTIVVSASYLVNETTYTKNFIYKTFVTSKLGMDIIKNGFTDNSLSFLVTFSDDLIKGARVEVLDSNDVPVPNKYVSIVNSGNKDVEVNFTGLQPDTKYRIRIHQIQYNGAVQIGTNWSMYYDDCTTLKQKASLDKLNYIVDKRNGNFKLFIENKTDKNNSIQDYNYVVYEYKKEVVDGKEILVCDTENIIYNRQTTENEIIVNVADADAVEGIARDKYYGFKVIANAYDNEKFIEFQSDICGPFVLSGETFPTLKFVQSEVTATKINGTLYISDPENTIKIGPENPLKIMYKNKMGDEKIYKQIINSETVEFGEDEFGENQIIIPIEESGLRADTTYVWSVYGSVELSDDEIYNDIFIGSAIVNTNAYKELGFSFSLNTSRKDASFAVDVNIEDDVKALESLENLESISFIMQAGSYFKTTEDYSVYEINNSNCNSIYPDAESLKDLLSGDNKITLTPSMIGGGMEQDYKEKNYIILATVTVDGTSYYNKIPVINSKNNEENGTTVFKDAKNKVSKAQPGEEYTAAYYIVETKAAMPGIPDKDIIGCRAIINSEAKTNYLEYKLYDERLDDDTIVGYLVQSNFRKQGSEPKSITYYVWGNQEGVEIKDGKGGQLIHTANFVEGSDNVPFAIFKVNQGTRNETSIDNETGMHRGGKYHFSYTVTYIEEGVEKIWPTVVDPSKDEKSLRTNYVTPVKQKPKFVLYPKSSEDDEMTYKYTFSDVDLAIYYEGDNPVLDLMVGDTIQKSYAILEGSNQITFSALIPNTTYKISYRGIVDKVVGAYSSTTLTKQKFEGKLRVDNVSYNVDYNANNPNVVKVTFNNITQELFKKIVGVKLNLTCEGISVKTPLLEIKDNGQYYVELDLLTLSGVNFANMKEKEVTVEALLYYESGQIGFEPEIESNVEYATYMNDSDIYMKIDPRGNFIEDVASVNKITSYKYSLDLTNMEYAYLKLVNNGTEYGYELNYSSGGFKYGDQVLVQRYVISTDIQNDGGDKFTAGTFIVGIRVNKITADLSSATINAEISNPLDNIKGNIVKIEIYESDDRVDWNRLETRTISIDSISEFKLENLNPAKFYKLKFKYTIDGQDVETYMYDMDAHIYGYEYEFETVKNVGISNVKVTYEPNKYNDKYLKIEYNVNPERSYMYKTTKYEFFDKNGVKVQLTENNIWINGSNGNIYKVIDGCIHVTNTIYDNSTKSFSNVMEKININPANNPFKFGEKYTLKITPMIDDLILDSASTEVDLKELKMPSIGIKMLRKETGTMKYMMASITIQDDDRIIVGGNSGEYTLKAFQYIGNEKVPVSIFDSIESTKTEITSSTFSIEDATNFKVYLCDVDFQYKYDLELHYKVDEQNDNNPLAKTETRTVNSVNSGTEVDIGRISIEKNEENGKMINIKSTDNYKIQNVNYIEYTIYNNNNNVQNTGSFEPSSEDWEIVRESELYSYAKVKIPDVVLNESGTYSVTLNFYKNVSGMRTLVGDASIEYTHYNNE